MSIQYMVLGFELLPLPLDQGSRPNIINIIPMLKFRVKIWP